MAFLAGLYRHRQLSSLSIQPNYCYSWSWRYLFLYPSSTTRCLCSGSTESTRSEFPFENAYNILGVPETSSFSEIKASFRKLAKKTHPDLAESKNYSAASKRFIQILAAYEVLYLYLFCPILNSYLWNEYNLEYIMPTFVLHGSVSCIFMGLGNVTSSQMQFQWRRLF